MISLNILALLAIRCDVCQGSWRSNPVVINYKIIALKMWLHLFRSPCSIFIIFSQHMCICQCWYQGIWSSILAASRHYTIIHHVKDKGLELYQLLGCVIMYNLISKSFQHTGLQSKIRLWSDSLIVIHWINSYIYVTLKKSLYCLLPIHGSLAQL